MGWTREDIHRWVSPQAPLVIFYRHPSLSSFLPIHISAPLHSSALSSDQTIHILHSHSTIFFAPPPCHQIKLLHQSSLRSSSPPVIISLHSYSRFPVIVFDHPQSTIHNFLGHISLSPATSSLFYTPQQSPVIICNLSSTEGSSIFSTLFLLTTLFHCFIFIVSSFIILRLKSCFLIQRLNHQPPL